MSLLMDALKQAESAKRDSKTESPTPAPAVEMRANVKLSLTPMHELPPDDDKATEGFATALLQQAEENAHKFTMPPTLDQPLQSSTTTETFTLAEQAPAPIEVAPAPAPVITSTSTHVNTGAEAAARILAASASRQLAQRRRKLYGNLGLGLVLCIAVGSYYFYAAMVQQPPPMVLPQSAGHTEPAAPATAAAAPIVTPAIKAAPTVAPVIATTQSTPSPAKQGAVTPQAAAVAAERPQTTSKAPEHRPASPEPATDESFMDMSSRGIKITRGTSSDTVLDDLQSAYSAYKIGQWELAGQDYQRVLTHQPGNRDARLGLAALAVRAGNYTAARTYYRELLHDNPKDTAALAALADLSESNSTNSESELKSMLAENPQAAQVQFALANVYAGQERWEYAQQAYFEAQRLATDNPDYAFNLAVSLEHLGKTRNALDFYRRAVLLAQRHPAQFAIASAQQRIDVLSTAAGQ